MIFALNDCGFGLFVPDPQLFIYTSSTYYYQHNQNYKAPCQHQANQGLA